PKKGAPLQRYLERKDENGGDVFVDLSSDITPPSPTGSGSASSEQVLALKQKTQMLAAQVAKLKEVGQQLTGKKDAEIKSLKAQVDQLKVELTEAREKGNSSAEAEELRMKVI